MAANRVQGGIFTVMTVRITDPYDPALDGDLKEQVARSPNFFLDAPVVLDLKDCMGCTSVADYVQLKAALRRHRLIPVGVTNASQIQLRAAGAVDLAPFNAAGSGRRPAEAPATAPAAAAAPAAKPQPAAPAAVNGADRPPATPAVVNAPATRTRLVTQPVRSGTQIYARGGDLIVTAPVSAGAEVIADGNIHIYGALRGRAIAGASGDEGARLFVHRLEAELICVAGRYLVSESIPAEHLNRPVQIALVEDELRILPG